MDFEELAKLTLSPQDELDLVWYYRDARALFGSIPCALNVGSGTRTAAWEQSGKMHLDRGEAYRRTQRIEYRLAQLPTTKRHVFEARFGETLTPNQIKQLTAYKEWSGLVVLIASRKKSSKRELYSASNICSLGTGKTKKEQDGYQLAREFVTRKIEEAKAVFLESVTSYNLTRKQGKRNQDQLPQVAPSCPTRG